MKELVQKIINFVTPYLLMFRDNLNKWLEFETPEGMSIEFLGLVLAGGILVLTLILIGLISSLKRHPKLFWFYVILLLIGAGVFYFFAK